MTARLELEATVTKTISDRVREVVSEAADRAAVRPLMEGWGRGVSRREIVSKTRAEVWRTPEGRDLRELDRVHGSEPYTPPSVSKIRKSKDAARFATAFEILDRGIQLPV